MKTCKILNISMRLLFTFYKIKATNLGTKMTHQISPRCPQKKKKKIRVHIKSLARHSSACLVLKCREWNSLQRQKRSSAIITRQCLCSPVNAGVWQCKAIPAPPSPAADRVLSNWFQSTTHHQQLLQPRNGNFHTTVNSVCKQYKHGNKRLGG